MKIWECQEKFEGYGYYLWLRHVVTPWGVNQGVSVAVKNYTPLLRI